MKEGKRERERKKRRKGERQTVIDREKESHQILSAERNKRRTHLIESTKTPRGKKRNTICIAHTHQKGNQRAGEKDEERAKRKQQHLCGYYEIFFFPYCVNT